MLSSLYHDATADELSVSYTASPGGLFTRKLGAACLVSLAVNKLFTVCFALPFTTPKAFFKLHAPTVVFAVAANLELASFLAHCATFAGTNDNVLFVLQGKMALLLVEATILVACLCRHHLAESPLRLFATFRGHATDHKGVQYRMQGIVR